MRYNYGQALLAQDLSDSLQMIIIAGKVILYPNLVRV